MFIAAQRIALSLVNKCNVRVEAVPATSWGNNLRIVHAEQLTISAARRLVESGQDEEHAARLHRGFDDGSLYLPLQ
jgi:hypothetical protein